jgi:hypothetical protein
MRSSRGGVAGLSAVAEWKAKLNEAYSRLFGRIGNMLLGRPNAIRMQLLFLPVMIALSLAMALGSALAPYCGPAQMESTINHWSYPLSAMWILAVVFMVRRCRVVGLWTLAGLPFALYWPAIEALLYVSCKWGHDCL